jgi:hypothetical protein
MQYNWTTLAFVPLVVLGFSTAEYEGCYGDEVDFQEPK